MMLAGVTWVTGPWRETPRLIEIDEVKNDEVSFHFEDGRESRCSIVAFRRVYEPVSW